MGILVPSVKKHCAVCAYWDGIRKLRVNNTHVDVPSSIQAGICRNPKALSTKGKPVKANYNACPRFEKWPELR